MAIMMRWRMPPDISWGYWRRRRAGSGMPTEVSRASAVSRACCLGDVDVLVERFGDLLLDPQHRVEGGHRILEDHRHLVWPQ
jgi:hypothetical protein